MSEDADPVLGEERRKYLDFIETTIGRLAGNSFQMKGWSVALSTVIIGLTAKDSQSRFALVALIPIICFWGLDAYYLALEQSFRRIFEEAAGLHGSPRKPLYDMKAVSDVGRWFACLWRTSVYMTHAPIALIAIIVAFTGPGNLNAGSPIAAPSSPPTSSPSSRR